MNKEFETETIANSLEKWLKELKEQELSENTIIQYRTSIKVFLNYLKSRSLDCFNKDTLFEYKDWLIDNYKTSTINIRIIGLNKYLKEIGLEDWTLKTLKVQKRNSLEDILTLNDYKRLLNWCDKLNKLRIKLIIQVLTGTGIRISELKYITVEAIVKQKGCLTVKNKGKERTIVVPISLCKALEQYCKDNDIYSGIIFHARDHNKMIDPRYFWRELKKIAGKARIKKSKVHAHAFRHLFAQIQIAHGIDVIELADLMGHSSLETTRLYTRTSAQQKQKRLTEIFDSI